MATPSVVSQLESFLSITNRRQTVIASNMANIDTPGYRTQDVNFQAELNRAMDRPAGEVPQVATMWTWIGSRCCSQRRSCNTSWERSC